jgi:hypothetical protein
MVELTHDVSARSRFLGERGEGLASNEVSIALDGEAELAAH